jgi:hypothetical protein
LARSSVCAIGIALGATCQHAHACRRRDPELSELHRFVRDHLEEFLLWTEEHFEKPLPRYVQRELRRFVLCGRLEHGFTRWRCKRCGHNMLVAFSCATRICPSCCGRRMAQAGAHLIDNVLPDAPLRQWVFTVPFPLRMLLAKDAALLSSVIRILVGVLERSYSMRAQQLGITNPKTGSRPIESCSPWKRWRASRPWFPRRAGLFCATTACWLQVRRFVRASCRFAIARTPTTSRVDTANLSRSNRQPGRSQSPPTPRRCLCPVPPQVPTRRRPCALVSQMRAPPRRKLLHRKPERGVPARRTSHGPS